MLKLVFQLKIAKLVLSFRSSDCRQNNITLSLQETLDDLKNKFTTFKNNYEEVFLKVLVTSASISTLKKNAGYNKSDDFSERIVSEATDRIHR